jgi:hypothetical protein
LHGLQTSATQWLRMLTQAASAPTAQASPPPPAARRSSLAVVAGSLQLLASPNDVGTAKASKAAPARRLERSFRPAPPVSPRAARRSMSTVAAYAAPPQTRLPIGGASAGGSGGLGSAASPVAAVFGALGLALATILLARFSLDLASWRSTLLASGLERPG